MGLRIGSSAQGLGTSGALNAVNGNRAPRRVEFRIDSQPGAPDAGARRQPPPNIPAAAAEALGQQMERARERAPQAEALREQAAQRLEARREELRAAAEAARERQEQPLPAPPPADERIPLDARIGQAPETGRERATDTGAATVRIAGQTFRIGNPVQPRELDVIA